MYKKISKTNKGPQRLENPKQLCREKLQSFFSFVGRHFEGFPRWEKSKRELIPKPSLEVPCPFLRLKRKGRERSKRTVVDDMSGRFDCSR